MTPRNTDDPHRALRKLIAGEVDQTAAEVSTCADDLTRALYAGDPTPEDSVFALRAAADQLDQVVTLLEIADAHPVLAGDQEDVADAT